MSTPEITFLFPNNYQSVPLYTLHYKISPPENLNISFLSPVLLNLESANKIFYIGGHDFCMLKAIEQKLPGNVENRMKNLMEKTQKFIVHKLKESCFSFSGWMEFVFPLYNVSTWSSAPKKFFRDKTYSQTIEKKLRNKILIPIFMLPIILLALEFESDMIRTIITWTKYEYATDDNFKLLETNLQLVNLFQSCAEKTKFIEEELVMQNISLNQRVFDLENQLHDYKKKVENLLICINNLTGQEVAMEE